MTKIDGGLRAIFRTKLPRFHWQSVESLGTGKGTPDSNYCFDGVDGWIEMKKTDANKVKSMKPEQVAWAERRLRAGGLTFFAVRETKKASGLYADLDALWLIRGRGGRSLYIGGLSGVSPEDLAGRWPGGPRGWDWWAISRILTSR